VCQAVTAFKYVLEKAAQPSIRRDYDQELAYQSLYLIKDNGKYTKKTVHVDKAVRELFTATNWWR
jgi:hypothetical protein